jgi:TP901 family phage tail tape measure protein
MVSKAKATVEITAKNKTSKGLSQAAKGFKLFERKLSRAIGGGAKKLAKITTGLAAVGVAASAAFAVSSVRKFAEFEASMKGIEAVLKPTNKELAALEAESKRLGRTTKFSATQAASAIEVLAKNGVKTEKILGGMLEASLKLSASLGSDLAASADVLTDAMSVFSIEGEKAGDVVDSINSVAINSKFGFEDYAKALASGGASAVAAGQSFDEFNDTITATASFFDSGETAGTAYKVFIDRLVPASAAAEAAQKKLGLSVFDSNGELKDMSIIAGQLDRGLADLSAKDRIKALTDLFGTRGKNFAVALARAGEEGLKTAGFLRQFADANAQAEKRMEGTEGGLKKLASSYEAFQLSIGGPLAETVSPFIDSITVALGEMSVEAESSESALTTFFNNSIISGAELLDLFRNLKTSLTDYYTLIGGGLLDAALAAKKASFIIAHSMGMDDDVERIKGELKAITALKKAAELAKDVSDADNGRKFADAVKSRIKVAAEIRDATAALRDQDVLFEDLQKSLQEATVRKLPTGELEGIKKLIAAQAESVESQKTALAVLKGIVPETKAANDETMESTEDVRATIEKLAKSAEVDVESILGSFKKLNSEGGGYLSGLKSKLDSVQDKLKETTLEGEKFHDAATKNSWLKDFALEGVGFLQALITGGLDPLQKKLATISKTGAVVSGVALSSLGTAGGKEDLAKDEIAAFEDKQPFSRGLSEPSFSGFNADIPFPSGDAVEKLEADHTVKMDILRKHGLEENNLAVTLETEKAIALKQIRLMQIAGYSQGFDSILSIMSSFGGKQSGIYRALFMVSRGFAAAEAFQAGELAVAKAAASAPPPYNTGAIVLARLQQVASVAAIATNQPSFLGGGYTGSGSRSGGVDGRGGFNAVLHPNETVTDHTKGDSAGGGGVVINMTINGDPSPSVVAQLREEISNFAMTKLANIHKRGGVRAAAVSSR